MLQGQLVEAMVDFEQALKLDHDLEPLARERIEAVRRLLESKH